MWRDLLKVTVAVLSVGLLGGCSSFLHMQTVASVSSGSKRHIAVFFDGTHNAVASDTNIKRLHALTVLQNRNDISALYVEGVGIGSDVTGMGTGLGLKPRVVLAYQFVLENYSKGDRVHIFGFSRGAFQARVLASMLYHAGLPRVEGMASDELAEKVFDIVKHIPSDTEIENGRLKTVHEALVKLKAERYSPVAVETLGLWDTVEALGLPDWGDRIAAKLGGPGMAVDVDAPNPRYGDQLCNVRNAHHALSIDDNRQWIFTPLLLTRKHLIAHCPPPSAEFPRVNINEVWFSGAHSDVGGGYSDSLLSGVSLNWMIDQLRSTRLLPKKAAVREDKFGTSHDPEGGLFAPVYHATNRNPVGYAMDKEHREEFTGLCFHSSVFERRSVIPPLPHEFSDFSLKSSKDEIWIAPERGSEQRPRWKEAGPDAPGRRSVKLESWPHCAGMNSRGRT